MDEGILSIAKTLGAALLLWVAVAYVLLPVAVKFTGSMRAAENYEVIGRHQLPPDVVAYMDQKVWDLQSMGFVPAALVRDTGAMSNVTLYLVLFTNPATADAAAATFTIGARVVTLRTATVGFDTTYPNGFAVETGNFADAGVYPPDPNRHRMHVPGLQSLPVLYELHRRRCLRHGPAGASGVLPAPGHELETVMAEGAREKERVRTAGYYSLDATAGKYRPTWKGAYVMTWKLSFPFGYLRRRAKRARARREMRDVGLDPNLMDAAILPAVPLMPVPEAAPTMVAPPTPPPVPQRPIT